MWPLHACPPKLFLSSHKVPLAQGLGNPEQGPQQDCEARAGSYLEGSAILCGEVSTLSPGRLADTWARSGLQKVLPDWAALSAATAHWAVGPSS